MALKTFEFLSFSINVSSKNYFEQITPETCLNVSVQLIEIIEMCLEANNGQSTLAYQIYLTALIVSLIEYGYDPRNAFSTILKFIRQNDAQIDDDILHYMLITMSQIIHNIAPFYLRNALEVVKVKWKKDKHSKQSIIINNFGTFLQTLNEQKSIDNVIICNMVMDSLIIRLAINGKNIPPVAAAEIERLIKQLRTPKNAKSKNDSTPIKNENKSIKSVLYLHPLIAMNFNLIRLSAEISSATQTNNLKRLISSVAINKEFAIEMHFFLRSILLTIEDSNFWSEILQQLVANAKDNSTISGGTIYFILYLLANETDGRKQMELLRGLTSFAAVKENIPIILNTYRSLSSSSSVALQMISIGLHTRLWTVESRTYQFLHKVLIADNERLTASERWELNIVKANSIKEICAQK